MGCIDGHCHLYGYKEEMPEILKGAERLSIENVIAVPIDYDTLEKNFDIYNEHRDFVLLAAGVHPNRFFKEIPSRRLEKAYDDVKKVIRFVREHEDDVALIGEIGLSLGEGERYRIYDEEEIEETLNSQEHVFRELLDLAEECEKGVIVHSWKAEPQTLKILKDYSNVKPVVLHYLSNVDVVDDVIAMGYYVSAAPEPEKVLSDDVKKVVSAVPMDRLLVETDGSKQINGFRPTFIPNVVEMVWNVWKERDDAKGKTKEDVANMLYYNMRKFLGLSSII